MTDQPGGSGGSGGSFGGGDQAARARLSTARRLHPGVAGRPSLDRLTALAARIVGVASAQVSVVTEVASTVGSSGVPAQLREDLPMADSLCAQTAATGRPRVVNDTRSDPETAGLPAVSSGAAGSFLGVPVRADDHSIVGALCVFDPAPRLWTQDDVATLEALAESAAAELELSALNRDFDANRARWDLAIDAAGVGSFDWDLRTGRLAWDTRLITLFGYDTNNNDYDNVFTESIEAFNARLHPDDLPGVTQALQRAIDTVGDFEAEYRVMLPNGAIRHVQARGRALTVGEGAVTSRLLGAAWDVSATRETEDRAAHLVEAMPVAYLRVDAAGIVLAGNQLAEQLLHVHRLDLLHRELWNTAPETIAARLKDLCAQVLATGNPATRELQFGPPIDAWLELRVVPEPGGLSLFFTDITRRRDEQAAADTIAGHNRDIAAALQQALLTQLPHRDDLELAARYIPAAATDQVGGDWFDALTRTDGTAAVVVGDVSGHDIDAAATMGQLRSILRAFLWQTDDTPAAVTAALDRAINDLYPGAMATAVTAVIEPHDNPGTDDTTHVLRWSSAGHLPPLVVELDGTVRRLDPPPQLMLGVQPETARRDHVAELASGSTLVLYTDGLIERRHIDIDTGIQRLTDSLRRHRQLPVEAMLDHVLEDLLDDDTDDDVAVLVVRPA